MNEGNTDYKQQAEDTGFSVMILGLAVAFLVGILVGLGVYALADDDESSSQAPSNAHEVTIDVVMPTAPEVATPSITMPVIPEETQEEDSYGCGAADTMVAATTACEDEELDETTTTVADYYSYNVPFYENEDITLWYSSYSDDDRSVSMSLDCDITGPYDTISVHRDYSSTDWPTPMDRGLMDDALRVANYGWMPVIEWGAEQAAVQSIYGSSTYLNFWLSDGTGMSGMEAFASALDQQVALASPCA